jgi:uncharacterized membrane protein YciS (DUF1049 family)
MKKVFGFLLVTLAFVWATPLSRIILAVGLILGWLVLKEYLKARSRQQKLRPIRIPVVSRKK